MKTSEFYCEACKHETTHFETTSTIEIPVASDNGFVTANATCTAYTCEKCLDVTLTYDF